MRKVTFFALLSLLFFGCNMNPNKEARIQELESKIELITKRADNLESSVLKLEGVNKELEARIIELEKQ